MSSCVIKAGVYCVWYPREENICECGGEDGGRGREGGDGGGGEREEKKEEEGYKEEKGG